MWGKAIFPLVGKGAMLTLKPASQAKNPRCRVGNCLACEQAGEGQRCFQ